MNITDTNDRIENFDWSEFEAMKSEFSR